MKYIYLSHLIDDLTPAYGGASTFSIQNTRSIVKGDPANSMIITLANHLGTHVDFPRHFFDEGKGADDYSAETMVFNRVALAECDVAYPSLVQAKDIDCAIDADTELLLVRTGSEKERGAESYWKTNVGLHPDAATLIREHGNIRAVGMDFISVSSWQNRELGREAHRILLNTSGNTDPVLIIEDMSLVSLITAPKKVMVAPLRIAGADGSPCTVLAEL